MKASLKEPWYCGKQYTDEYGNTHTCQNTAESASDYIDAETMLSCCSQMKSELDNHTEVDNVLAKYCEIDEESLSIEGQGVNKIVTAAQGQVAEEISNISTLLGNIEDDVVDAYNYKQEKLDNDAKLKCNH